MSPARRHHFISQFYLRNFVAGRTASRLFVVDLKEQRSFETSTGNVGVENDFHTISVAGLPPDEIEKRVAQFESEAAAALAHVIDRGYVGDDEDACNVLFFATLLLIKNPAMRQTANGAADELLKKISQMEARDPVVWAQRVRQLTEEGLFEPGHDFEHLRQELLRGDYTITLSPEAHMGSEFENARELLPYLSARRWNFYRAKVGRFVTCDRPVVLMWSDPTISAPPGLALRNTRLLFPLSDTVAINGGFELANEMVELNEEDVAKINGHIILNASRYVYAQDGNFLYTLVHNGCARRGVDLPTDEMLVHDDVDEPQTL